MSTLSFIPNRCRVIGSLVALGSFGAAVYLGKEYRGKRQLDQICRRVPVAALPKPSACRNLLETRRETTAAPAWGLETPAVTSSWPGGDNKMHWTPSFAALQVEVPLSALARYGSSHGKDNDEHGGAEGDAFCLMQTFVAGFLDGRRTGAEAQFLDKNVPPLSFAPGSQLFGDRSGLGAFVLDTWSTARGKCVQPLDLPKDPPPPVSEFPSNTAVREGGPIDTAGTVMYWRFTGRVSSTMDRLASWGLPWRMMEGGFQEFIVEKVSDQAVRLTYAMVESANLHPGGQSRRDFKRMPWLAYELHVLYGRILLYKTLRRFLNPS